MFKWKPAPLDEDGYLYIVRLRAQDEAFCNRLRAAIEAGEESCPIGVITDPGTKRPLRYERAQATTAQIKVIAGQPPSKP